MSITLDVSTAFSQSAAMRRNSDRLYMYFNRVLDGFGSVYTVAGAGTKQGGVDQIEIDTPSGAEKNLMNFLKQDHILSPHIQKMVHKP
jgi:hypothetical protein